MPIPRSWPIFAAACLLLAPAAARVPPDHVEYIPSRAYFSTVQRELAQAKSSIVVGLYLFVLRPNASDSPVFQLAQSLKKAHAAGVRVEILLDQNIDFVSGEGPLAEGKNAAAHDFLTAQGIPVSYDTPGVLTHAKAVVIDESTVILGSSNWTDAALNHNHEANVLIRSTAVAQGVLAALRAVPRLAPPARPTAPAARVPVDFLLDARAFGRMVSSGDERSFDTYLFLLRQRAREPGPSFALPDAALADALGIAALGRDGYRRQIAKTLKKLQDRYGLIHFQPVYNGAPWVTVLSTESARAVEVPDLFWSGGWCRRLGFAGKSAYLFSRLESAASPFPPRWSTARSTLAARHHVSPWFVSRGVTELRRHNLLEVEYAPFVPDSPVPRPPSTYTPNELYDIPTWERRFAKLRERHGPEKVARAQRAARLVYEDADLNALQALIALEDQHGPAQIQAVLKMIGEKNPDNPHRTIAYLIGAIRAPRHRSE